MHPSHRLLEVGDMSLQAVDAELAPINPISNRLNKELWGFRTFRHGFLTSRHGLH